MGGLIKGFFGTDTKPVDSKRPLETFRFQYDYEYEFDFKILAKY